MVVPGARFFYSRYISDADRLPETGNVLVTDGARETDAAGVAINDPSSHRWARIVELAHTTPAEKVFELVIEDEDPIGWHVYRATRVSSLDELSARRGSPGAIQPFRFIRRSKSRYLGSERRPCQSQATARCTRRARAPRKLSRAT